MSASYWSTGSIWRNVEQIAYGTPEGTWQTVDTISRWNGTSWEVGYRALKKVTIDGGNTSKNLRNQLDALGITQGDVEITLTGNFYGNPALRTGDLSHLRSVHIINNGLISGSGGAGGTGSDGRHSAGGGGAGGTAFYVDTPITVTNNGTIRGGGGGGGGGGGYSKQLG